MSRLSAVKESTHPEHDSSSHEESVCGANNSLGGASAASVGAASICQNKGLKRSPYLSQITAGDSDLMAMLSRPASGAAVGAMGGGNRGGLDFFQLSRPRVAGGGKLEGGSRNSTGSSGLRGGVSVGNLGSQTLPTQRLSQPHLRSSLRSGHKLRTLEHNGNNAASLDEHRNVTFSQNTKGSQLDLVDAVKGGPPANASVLVPDAPPQAADDNDKDPITNQSPQSPTSEPEAKPQFPFYFSTLSKEPHLVSPSPEPADLADRPPQNAKCKSTSTLQYYYKAGMRGGASANILADTLGEQSAFSKSLRNLTFREMLDEGDGKEGDLNLRLRNEQWKAFRSSSCGTESVDGEASVPLGERMLSPSLLGNKRALTPSSSANSSNDNIGNADSPAVTMHDHPQSGAPRNAIGSHRGCVSAYDLAVFRRSASRIKVNPSDLMSTAGDWDDVGQMQQVSRPGEMLGASMLSRISSGGESFAGGSAGGTPASASRKPADPMPSLNSPLAQMMANKFGATTGMTPGSRPRTQQQHATGMPSSLMGRRVHTVSAGLAYGSAGFTVDPKTRLSKFDLGKADSSALSIASGGGNGGGGYRKNEEWM